ncbi:hypothetical protein M4I21_16750 [Cellulophaga sp. 20_2_10]|uniref:hypothetical protein n=1 Tax=Cellulophaga sp. 20_2_10 TaxID=2942476 RepID=UPI00201AD02E|nr:hypothetical protein [Cellulophaga sp. 20_2_10]MCL5247472.1 hypothetical protein [Cellulophaga sp. 20_2_10]
MKKKILFIGFGIFLLAFLLYYVSWSFSPGSYGKAEAYELPISEKTLIEIITTVKTENNLKTNSLNDHKNGHWYSIYFEYKDKKQLIHALTRPKNETNTTLYFSGYKSKEDLGNWIDANEYFWWWKNSKVKKEFESRILDKIKDKIKKQKPNTVANNN